MKPFRRTPTPFWRHSMAVMTFRAWVSLTRRDHAPNTCRYAAVRIRSVHRLTIRPRRASRSTWPSHRLRISALRFRRPSSRKPPTIRFNRVPALAAARHASKQSAVCRSWSFFPAAAAIRLLREAS